MLKLNIRRTLSMTLGAVETTAGDARAWLDGEAPATYEAYKAAAAGTVEQVGERVAKRLRTLFARVDGDVFAPRKP